MVSSGGGGGRGGGAEKVRREGFGMIQLRVNLVPDWALVIVLSGMWHVPACHTARISGSGIKLIVFCEDLVVNYVVSKKERARLPETVITNT